MKNLLATLCLLMVLLGGGCTLIVLSSGGVGLLTLLPIAVVILNAFVLAAVWGKRPPSPAAFYTLAAIDFVSAAGTLAMLVQMGSGVSDILVPGVLLAGIIAVKGALTIWFIRSNGGNSTSG